MGGASLEGGMEKGELSESIRCRARFARRFVVATFFLPFALRAEALFLFFFPFFPVEALPASEREWERFLAVFIALLDFFEAVLFFFAFFAFRSTTMESDCVRF